MTVWRDAEVCLSMSTSAMRAGAGSSAFRSSPIRWSPSARRVVAPSGSCSLRPRFSSRDRASTSPTTRRPAQSGSEEDKRLARPTERQEIRGAGGVQTRATGVSAKAKASGRRRRRVRGRVPRRLSRRRPRPSSDGEDEDVGVVSPIRLSAVPGTRGTGRPGPDGARRSTPRPSEIPACCPCRGGRPSPRRRRAAGVARSRFRPFVS